MTEPTKKEQTPWERFVALARKVTQTPKAEVEKREREWREERRERKSRS
jgi:hypothetical protein